MVAVSGQLGNSDDVRGATLQDPVRYSDRLLKPVVTWVLRDGSLGRGARAPYMKNIFIVGVLESRNTMSRPDSKLRLLAMPDSALQAAALR